MSESESKWMSECWGREVEKVVKSLLKGSKSWCVSEC